MFKEYQQLNYVPMPGKTVFGSINNEELIGGHRNKSLEAVNLIKEKLCVKIKGGTCENGSR